MQLQVLIILVIDYSNFQANFLNQLKITSEPWHSVAGYFRRTEAEEGKTSLLLIYCFAFKFTFWI